MRFGRNRFASELSQGRQCTNLGCNFDNMNYWNNCDRTLCLLGFGDIVGREGYCQRKGLEGITKNQSYLAGPKRVITIFAEVDVVNG